VHLFYQAPPGTLFYNEVTVQQSRPGSYFQVCGFSHGYFGIQELGNKKKVAIFSVWDPGDQNDPATVPADRQVELVSKGPGVRAGRFGGEGTGGQSFFDFNWKNGEAYRFLVRATVQGKKTEYAGFFYLNQEHRWQEMAAFRTLTGGSPLTGYYSFIEDFRRDGKSAKETRRALYGNGWIQTPDGDWISLCRARFTADNNPSLNIDAGLEGDQFFLANGGATMNHTPLHTLLTRSPLPVSLPPPLP